MNCFYHILEVFNKPDIRSKISSFLWSLMVLFGLIFFTHNAHAQDFVDEIIGGNSPDDFANFSNMLPDPSFTGDGSYSIELGTVVAGGGLDFPLVLTYSTSRIKAGASSGHVGLGWDLNIGEVVRSLNCLPDEQSPEWFLGIGSAAPLMDMGHNTTGNAFTLEDYGASNGGDVRTDGQEFEDWDNYNISTPYDSKSLVPIRKGNNAEYYFLERPYSSWYVDFTEDIQGTSSILQFQMIDDNGWTYLFDKPHNVYVDRDGDGVKTSSDDYGGGHFLFYTFPTSWKLTRIENPNSAHYVDFIYDEYARVASGQDPYSMQVFQFDNNMDICGKSVYHDFDALAHIAYDESTIKTIETASHVVEFEFEDDSTSLQGAGGIYRRRLASIKFKKENTGEVYKEIYFGYVDGESPRHNTGWKDINLLDHIKFKDLESSVEDEYYTFTYYTDSVNDFESQFFGYVKQYNYLDVVTLPTGGEIDFDYEDRKYNFYYQSSGAWWDMKQKYTSNSNNGDIGYRAGSRVERVTMKGVDDSNPDVVRDYEYGDAIRIESRFQDLLQESSFPLDWGFDYAKSIMSHVGHRWVEIVDSEGGFTKNYYTSGISHPGLHYDLCDSSTDCPAEISEEEAKSVYWELNPHHSGGQFLDDNSWIPSQVPIYDTYPEIYGKVYKSETGYYSDYPTNTNPVITHHSESKWNMVESEFKYPGADYSDVLNLQQSTFVYNYHTKNITEGKETHTYYANFFRYGACGETYDYRFRNDELNFLGSPLNKVVMNSDYDTFYYGFSEFEDIIDNPDYQEHLNSAYIERKFTLSEEYPADVCWYNDLNTVVSNVIFRDEATYVHAGRTSSYSLIRNIYEHLIDFDPNDLGNSQVDVGYPYPLIYVPYIQSSHENPFHSGWYTKWDYSDDGFFLPRETWVLESVGEAGTCEGGLAIYCDIDDYGRKVQTFDEYDAIGNLIETTDILGTTYAYERAEDGNLIGVFKNATVDEVFAHSFAYDGLNGWVENDRNDDGDVEFSVVDGKLRINDLPGDNERDYVGYDLGTEISGSVVWEFDVRIPESDNVDFQMNAGGSDWNFYTSNSASETAIWSAINNEEWKVFNASSWITLKTGLKAGDTYRFKIIMHSDNNTADYYLNNEELASGVSFRFGSSGIQKIAFGLEGNGSDDSVWDIDNVRLYPTDAWSSSQELAANGRPLAIKGMDGATERFEYDGHSRLTSYISKSGNLVSNYDYNYTASYDDNTGELSYSYLTPNNLESFGFANSGPDDYLESRLGYLKFDYYPQVISFGDVAPLDAPAAFSVSLWFNRSADVNDPTNHTIDNVLVAQSSNSSNDNFEIGTDGTKIEIYLDTQNSDTYRTHEAGIVNNQWYHLAFTYSASADQANLYLDGELIKTWTEWGGNLDNSSGSPLTLGMARPDNEQWGVFEGEMSNVRVYGYALSDSEVRQLSLTTKSVSYFDGLGRLIQSHGIGDGESVVSGQLYDSRGLQVASSRPISEPGSGYITDLFGSTFTPGNALPGNSPIEDYYDPLVDSGDEDYAYSFTEYEQSMTNRVLETTLPGYDHRAGSGNENTMSYATNTVSISTSYKTWATGELFKTISLDPSGHQSISYTDYLGRTVVSGVDMDNSGELSGSSDLITTFEYDYNGNLVLVEDPRGLQTTYSYNALGELLEKKLPDQDHPNEYCYDDKGRLRFHASPNDFDDPYNYSGTDHYGYTYSKYDEFDRLVEIGVQDPSFVGNNSQASFDIICANSTLVNDQNEPSANNTPTIIYDYDGVNAASGARNYQGRVSQVQYEDPHSGNWGYTWYSYNELGLVEWVRQRHPGYTNYDDRTISYSYDELSRLTKLSYDEGYSTTGDHHFWYYYDELGRLEKVTSHGLDDEGSATTEAEYTYYADGQVEQLVLGNGVQTIDYDYTIQGWLDDINNGSPSTGDVFAMSLGYELNGNISGQSWYQEGWYTSGLFPNYTYSYDNANRLTEACYGYSCSSMSSYDVKYSYDKNGNLDWIDRHGESSDSDEYYMSFESGTNRLESALVYVDGVSSATETFDYDASGNMTENGVQGITSTTYDWRNLPTQVVANSSTINYGYDAEGSRIMKSLSGGASTYYVRGADGQTLAVYEGNTLKFLNILAGGQIIGQIIKN